MTKRFTWTITTENGVSSITAVRPWGTIHVIPEEDGTWRVWESECQTVSRGFESPVDAIRDSERVYS